MSFEHDLQNLPRLSDDDQEALSNNYSVMPALMDDETIARRDAAHEAGRTESGATQMGKLRDTIYQAQAIIHTVAAAHSGTDRDGWALGLSFDLLQNVASKLDDLTAEGVAHV